MPCCGICGIFCFSHASGDLFSKFTHTEEGKLKTCKERKLKKYVTSWKSFLDSPQRDNYVVEEVSSVRWVPNVWSHNISSQDIWSWHLTKCWTHITFKAGVTNLWLANPMFSGLQTTVVILLIYVLFLFSCAKGIAQGQKQQLITFLCPEPQQSYGLVFQHLQPSSLLRRFFSGFL